MHTATVWYMGHNPEKITYDTYEYVMNVLILHKRGAEDVVLPLFNIVRINMGL